MTERKLVPNIRFMNFDIEWNTVKLSRLLNVYDGVHQTPKYTKNGVPFVSVENIRNLKTNKYISKNDFDLQFKSSKPAYGDLLMTRIGDIGTVNIVKSDGDLAYYVSLALLKPKGELCKNFRSSYYLMYLIESPRVKKELWKRTLHIAFPKKINKNEISKITIYTSSDIREQQKIGDLFAKLDRLLDLQQQKLDQLELLKKALLQKLFPKQGAKIPELRFKGFEEEWKKKKFLNCLTKIIDYRGRTPKKLGQKWSDDGKYRALSALNVKNGYIDKNNDVHFGDFNLYKKWMGKSELKKGDILFTTEAPMGNVAIINDNEKYILSQRTIAFRVDQKFFNNLFLSYILRTTTVNNKLKSLSTGGTAQGVSQKSLSYLVLMVTNNAYEQQKIGNLLAKIDRLIELENKKFSNLKLVKKSLLQNMFVE